MAVSEFTGTLKEKRMLTDDVLFLSFQVPDSFSFEAGQYVSMKIIREAEFRMKSYSILNPPSEKGKLNLCIKLIPNGFASEAFKNLKLGETLSFRGPLGFLTFDVNGGEHWFIANGTGITPFYSMILEYIRKYPQHTFNLIFGVRSQKDLFLHQEFLDAAKEHPNFTYIPTLSRDAWEGSMGRVQTQLPLDLQGKTFYICGLKEMVLETKELLLQKGVPKGRIRVERYT